MLSFNTKKIRLGLRSKVTRVVVAALVGTLVVPIGSFTFPFFATPAQAAVTNSSGTNAYTDVPFTCEPKFYQTAAPNTTNYPAAGDGNSPRLFEYNPITNRYVGRSKVIPLGPSSQPNSIGYNTIDNYIYGTYTSTASPSPGFGDATTKYIVKIDSTGNYRLQSTFTWAFNAISGDFWKKGSQNRLVIHGGRNFATLDVTNTSPQTAVELLTATTDVMPALDIVIVGDNAYGMRGRTLYILNLNTLVGSTKAVNPVSSPGSTPIANNAANGGGANGDAFGSAFADSGGNLYFFNNETEQVWMIEAAQLSQTVPQIKPLGTGTSFMEGSTSGVTLPNDGASCPNAGSPYSSVITNSTVSNLTTTSATITSTVNPINISTTAKHCWATTSSVSGGALQNCTLTSQPSNASTGSPLTGSSAIDLNSLQISGLSPGTTYYWQTVTTSSWADTYGPVNSFTTLAPPLVSTTDATSIASTTANLNGIINSRGNTTTTSFCY